MNFAEHIDAMDQEVLTQLAGAEVISYVAGDAQSVDLSANAVYDGPYQLVGAGVAGVQSDAPQLFCRIDDLPSNPKTDSAARIFVNAQRYLIRETQPDGQGGVMLLLHKDLSA